MVYLINKKEIANKGHKAMVELILIGMIVVSGIGIAVCAYMEDTCGERKRERNFNRRQKAFNKKWS